MSSDIWDEFEKIAVAQGLVSLAEDEGREQEDPSKMPARYDSLSNDAIRLLYGIEPDLEAQNGHKSIIEIAHPETAVICRTYDAMNAVVENVQQRQDMMAYIALKMPNGHLTQHRYVAAKGDLVKALTSVAFTLDNKDEEELMVLADFCTERLVRGDVKKSEITKEALAPALIAGVAGGAALLAATYHFFYGGTTAQNVYANANIVLDELADLADRPYAGTIRKDVEKIKTMAEKIYGLKGELINIKSVDDVLDFTESQKSKTEAIVTQVKDYLTQLTKVENAIPQWVAAIKSDNLVSKEESSNWFAKLRQFQRYLPDIMQRDPDQLIDALWGKRNVTDSLMGFIGGPGESASQHNGGLLEAIQQDKAGMLSMLQSAEGQMQERETEKAQEQQVAVQFSTQPQQNQTPQFTTQMPSQNAPWASQEPTGGGAARTRPEGFLDLPDWG